MKRNYFITFLGSVLLPTIASAISPCELSSRSNSIEQSLASKFSDEEILAFKNDLQAECKMQRDFKSISERSRVLNIDLQRTKLCKA